LRIAQVLRDEDYVVAVAGRRRERVEAMIGSGFKGYAIDVPMPRLCARSRTIWEEALMCW
jgi:hypothetical protein